MPWRLGEFGGGDLVLVDRLEHEGAERQHRVEHVLAHAHLSEAAGQRLLHDVGHQPADALGGGSSEHGDRVARQEVFADDARPAPRRRCRGSRRR